MSAPDCGSSKTESRGSDQPVPVGNSTQLANRCEPDDAVAHGSAAETALSLVHWTELNVAFKKAPRQYNQTLVTTDASKHRIPAITRWRALRIPGITSL